MPLRARVAVCLPFCHHGWGWVVYFFLKTYQSASILMGSVSVSVCLSVISPDIPFPALPQTFFLLDLFRKIILTFFNMPSIDHAFCEISYLCDLNRRSMQSREVVRTFNRTSLSDRAGYRVLDFGNPAKIQGRMQTYHVPAPPKCHASRVKNNSSMLP